MLNDIMFPDDTRDLFEFKPARIAGICHAFPDVLFLGSWTNWRWVSALWAFEEEIEFATSVITHETIHLTIHSFDMHSKKIHNAFDRVCRKLLNTPWSLNRLEEK